MRAERLEVSVTFDEQRGYVGTAPRGCALAIGSPGLRPTARA